jgi:hypothetical protein
MLGKVGPVAGVGRRDPVSALTRGERLCDALGANRPPPFPAEDQVVALAPLHAFLSGTSRLQLSIPLRGPGPRRRVERRE